MREVYELTDDSTGDFLLDTSSGSRYLLDLRRPRRTMTRLPRENIPLAGYDMPEALRELRRDGEPLPILGIATIKVGRPSGLWIVVTDGVITLRRTSPVTRIAKLESEGTQP